MSTAAVGGRLSVAPAVERIAGQVREAASSRTALRVVGAGTWLDAGRPVADARLQLETSEASGITEYVPGDLTLTALAGTSLAELHEATRANGQRLALDPYGTDAGTLGATIATASSGPLAGAFGTPRDNVLGLTMVTGSGDVVNAGGRVVKNVAGFDLVRLATGSWGTLGVIAEVSMRLRALPAVDETYAIPLDAGDGRAVEAALRTLRALPFTFDAVELLDDRTAAALGLGSLASGGVLARVGGSGEVARAMHAALGAVGQAYEAPGTAWEMLRRLEPAASATVRLSHAPARAAQVWRAATEITRATAGFAHLAVRRAVARVTIPRREGESDTALTARIDSALGPALAAFDGMCIGERLPADAWRLRPFAVPRDDVLARLERGVRGAFDPARLLNRGILGRAGGED